MAEIKYCDLAVIGAGPGGYVAAIKAAQAGLKTIIIEKDKVGGTCLHKGCIPTKFLLQSAYTYNICKNSEDYGISISNVGFDISKIHKRKERIIRKNAQGIKYLLKKNNVELINGEARLESSKDIRVIDKNGKQFNIGFEKVILATGSVPFVPANFNIDEPRIFTSDQILYTQEIPASIVIIGGGAIGVEFASFYNSMGSNVTIVEMLENLVPLEDKQVSNALENSFKKAGITIKTGCTVDEVKGEDDGLSLKIDDLKGNGEKVKTSALLLAIGRMPLTGAINIEKLRLEMNGRFIKVNEYNETSVRNIYAIGDLCGPILLAHAASAQASLAIDHIAGKDLKPLKYHNIPKTIYSFPQIASIGITEAEARKMSKEIKVSSFPFAANGKASIIGDSSGFIKIISNNSGRILGVHMVGHNVSELIAEISAVFEFDITDKEFSHVIHPHPTLSEVIHEVFLGSFAKPLHI